MAIAKSQRAEELQRSAESAHSQDELELALDLVCRACALVPADFNSSSMAAVMAADAGELALSQRFFAHALSLDPSNAPTRLNFSSLLLRQQKFDRARIETERLIAGEPRLVTAHNNRAIALQSVDRMTEAQLAYGRAIYLAPAQNPRAETNLGQLLLSARDYQNGWRYYAARFRVGGADHPSSLPMYQPAIGCRNLLLWGDQGLGDQIMFGSMLNDFQRTQQPFALQIDDRLLPLFKRAYPKMEIFGGARVIDEHAFDARLALGDLGGILRDSEACFSQQPEKFLVADPDLVALWGARLRGAGDSPVVGVSWRSVNVETGRQRSLGLDLLAILLSFEGARFVNLQYGSVAEDLAALRARPNAAGNFMELPDLDKTLNLEGLAAVIESCDLVITIGNTTAHLAAALGKPTWVLLPKPAGWRWMHEGSRTPWYPSARLYRQHRVGDWSGVLADVQDDLRRWVTARGDSTSATQPNV